MTNLKERYKNLRKKSAIRRRDVAEKARQSLKNLKDFFAMSGRATYASMCFMGAGQIVNGQYIKGIVYILAEVGFIVYFALRGIKDLFGFFTLGTVKADSWLGIKGDDSVIMLLMGIFAWIALVALIIVYVSNIKDAHRGAEDLLFKGKVSSFKDDLSSMMNRNFYKAALVIPILGVMIFNVLPIIFMILIAFTNYGGKIVPPELVDWSLDSFKKLVALGNLSQSFGKILGWNLLWAFLSTFINYFLGLGLAILYNKKCVKPKALWRAFLCCAGIHFLACVPLYVQQRRSDKPDNRAERRQNHRLFGNQFQMDGKGHRLACQCVVVGSVNNVARIGHIVEYQQRFVRSGKNRRGKFLGAVHKNNASVCSLFDDARSHQSVYGQLQ